VASGYSRDQWLSERVRGRRALNQGGTGCVGYRHSPRIGTSRGLPGKLLELSTPRSLRPRQYWTASRTAAPDRHLRNQMSRATTYPPGQRLTADLDQTTHAQPARCHGVDHRPRCSAASSGDRLTDPTTEYPAPRSSVPVSHRTSNGSGIDRDKDMANFAQARNDLDYFNAARVPVSGPYHRATACAPYDRGGAWHPKRANLPFRSTPGHRDPDCAPSPGPRGPYPSPVPWTSPPAVHQPGTGTVVSWIGRVVLGHNVRPHMAELARLADAELRQSDPGDRHPGVERSATSGDEPHLDLQTPTRCTTASCVPLRPPGCQTLHWTNGRATRGGSSSSGSTEGEP
jgi:hypothetical protein